MRLRWMCALCIFGVLSPGWLVAGEPSESLDSIPSEAAAFICIPNPEALDADVQSVIQSLGLTGMVPLPNNSILTLLQAQLPVMQNMDADEPLIIAIMPGDDITEMNNTQVLMIPSENPKGMIDQLEGSESDGAWTVSIKGKNLSANTRDDYLLLADRAAILKDLEESKSAMQSTVAAPVAAGMADLDIIVGLNMPVLADAIEPWLEENFYPLMESQASTDLEKKSVALQKKQFSRLLQGLNMFMMGARMEDDGLAFRMVIGVKEGSEISKSMHMAVSSESLLKGLPAEAWALASAQVMDKKQAQAQLKSLDEMFEVYEEADGVDSAKLTKLRESVAKCVEMSRGYRMSISPSGDDAEGVFGMTVIAAAEDSQEWIEEVSNTFTLSKEVLGGLGEDASDYLNAIAMEEQGDAAVFSVDLSQVDDLDEDQVDMITELVGSDMAFRMKALNDTEVLISLGGGAARLETLANSTDTSALAQHPGIKELAEFLPTERNSITYVFVDQCIELARKVLVAIDEDDLPFPTPDVDAPIAVSATGGKNWSMVDIVIPMEVIEAGRDIGMTIMGAQ